MLKVLYLINYAGSGGTERYVENLLRRMNGREVEAYFAYNVGGRLADTAAALGIPCRKLEMRGPLDMKAAMELRSYIREKGIQVVHTQFLREANIAALARLLGSGARVVRTYHILSEDGASVRLMNKATAPLISRYVANCTAGRETLIKNGVPAGKISIVYNGLDTAAWHVGKGEANERFTMLYAARLTAGKGHMTLLAALKRLTELTERPFTMLLAGDGELRQELEAAYAPLGERVRFLGLREDMPELYAKADLTVCPSDSETLSFLLLESMSAGTPVLATAVGGILDIIDHSSHAGLLVPPGDPEALARGMLRFMEEPELLRSCGAAALEEARRRFDISAVAKELLEVYEGRRSL